MNGICDNLIHTVEKRLLKKIVIFFVKKRYFLHQISFKDKKQFVFKLITKKSRKKLQKYTLPVGKELSVGNLGAFKHGL